MTVPDETLLEALRALDTPTVCNALEVVAPKRRGYGYTVDPLVCTRPELGSTVGYARTATIRAMHPSDLAGAEARAMRDGYYSYVDDGPKPSVMVIQDLDGESRGYGSYWGEVNSNIHSGLGCIGLITDGSVRDLPDVAEGFQMLADRVGPSHAFVHPVGFGTPVTVAGMRVKDGDLVHADQHGAVVIPHEVAEDVPGAAAAIARREAVIIQASQEPGFDMERLRQAWGDAAEIH
ncbi:MAG: RraA family protein [Gammaproteobacteria bacterium]|nr:RraA family protein [Gammaproteobacteria bacterium]MYE81544.1 RraA family protein [Gammaproteobacteria bacterium]